MTGKGTVHAEHVANVGGLWAREVTAMSAVYLPLMPMERHYIVTDDVPEIYERDSEHTHVVDRRRRRRPAPGGTQPFGRRAMMSLRLDRLFGSWLREY